MNLGSLLEAALFVTALSMDGLVAAFAYGAGKIRIPFSAAAVISLISSGVLAAALFVGAVVRPFVPPELTKAVCFTILFFLGLLRLGDSISAAIFRRHPHYTRGYRFSCFHLDFDVRIQVQKPEQEAKTAQPLSVSRAAVVALALSLDGLAAGFGAGLVSADVWEVVICSVILGFLAVRVGAFLGRKVAEKISLNLSWISGALLILLAFLKLP